MQVQSVNGSGPIALDPAIPASLEKEEDYERDLNRDAVGPCCDGNRYHADAGENAAQNRDMACWSWARI